MLSEPDLAKFSVFEQNSQKQICLAGNDLPPYLQILDLHLGTAMLCGEVPS